MFEYLRLLNVLARYRTKEQFLDYTTRRAPFSLPKKESILIAYDLMENQFGGVRRESGGPYMDHLRSVATILMIHLRVPDSDEILAALLHDVREHFPDEWTNDRIEDMYGKSVARMVDIMTKPRIIRMPGETDENYDWRIENRNQAYQLRFETAEMFEVRLKSCDWMHNILTLIYCTPTKQRRKWIEAIQYALPRAKRHDVLYKEMLTALYSPVLFVFPSIPGPIPIPRILA